MPKAPRSIAFPGHATLLVLVTPEQVIDATNVQPTSIVFLVRSRDRPRSLMLRLLVCPRCHLPLSRQEGNREQRASLLGFHELECFGVLDTAFCSPTPVHPFVDLPDFLWSLTLVLVKRS